MNVSVCLLFITHHLLHSLFSSSVSLTLTPCCSNAIIIPAYPIFFKGVKCTCGEIFSILVSVSLLLSVSLSLFFLSLSLSLFHSLLESYPSFKAYIMSLMFVKGMTMTVMLSTAIMQPQQSVLQGEKSYRAVVENSREHRHDSKEWVMEEFGICFAHWIIHSGPYIPSCSLVFTITYL